MPNESGRLHRGLFGHFHNFFVDSFAVLQLFLLLNIAGTQAIEINNGIEGTPSVLCQDGTMSLLFSTQKPFVGRVYVKGYREQEGCARNFTGNGIDVEGRKSMFSVDVTRGDCGAKAMETTGEWNGVLYTLTLLVSFHPTFLTKVDRGYKCSCFFHSSHRVINQLELNGIQVNDVMGMNVANSMPSCEYRVHLNSPNGPLATQVALGAKLFHVWECDDPKKGFLVHSCSASDGAQSDFGLYDASGCAVDPVIMSDIRYSPDLGMAIVESHGFKFSDVSTLQIECFLQFCQKDSGQCDGFTPPDCTSKGRSKRRSPSIEFNANDPKSHFESVLRTKLSVEEIIPGETVENDLMKALIIPSESRSYHPELCLSPMGIWAISLFWGACIILTITSSLALYKRSR